MIVRFAAVLLAFCLAAPVSAQQKMAEYFAMISREDMRNSSGAPLGDFCAIIAQDRANFHRYGIRQELDQSDPIFGAREMRALIPQICAVREGHEYVAASVLSGTVKYVWVHIYGSGGVPSLMLVGEGAG